MVLQREENKGVESLCVCAKGLRAVVMRGHRVSGEESNPAPLNPKGAAPSKGVFSFF